MDDKRFEEIYEQACNHEITDDETDIIVRLMKKDYNDQYEAITTAYLFGKLT